MMLHVPRRTAAQAAVPSKLKLIELRVPTELASMTAKVLRPATPSLPGGVRHASAVLAIHDVHVQGLLGEPPG